MKRIHTFNDDTIWGFGDSWLGYKFSEIPTDVFKELIDSNKDTEINWNTVLGRTITYGKRRIHKEAKKPYKNFGRKGFRYITNGYVIKHLPKGEPMPYQFQYCSIPYKNQGGNFKKHKDESKIKISESVKEYCNSDEYVVRRAFYNASEKMHIKMSKLRQLRMQKHTKVYYDHFKFGLSDFVPCEICGRRAVDIHHIESRGMGGSKTDKNNINNLMAVCREGHLKFGDIKDLKMALVKIHAFYMANHIPYVETPCDDIDIETLKEAI